MKDTTRNVTRTVALALALLAAPAAFAGEGSDAARARDAHCACMGDHARCAKGDETRRDETQRATVRGQERSSAAEAPIFTDQG